MTIDPIAAILLFLALVLVELVHVAALWQLDRIIARLLALLHVATLWQLDRLILRLLALLERRK